MNDNVSAYFQASKELTSTLREVRKRSTEDVLASEIPVFNLRLQNATARVDEFIELFTWETEDTDLIRIAFLDIAKNTLRDIGSIRLQHPYGASNMSASYDNISLINNVENALRKALSSKGRYVSRIALPIGVAVWCYDLVEDYLTAMRRQLQSATFDNLLEAVTYFEKSIVCLRVHYQSQAKSKRF